jgi:succinate-semialdehyde dehydrogenase/glutarate-semialdehyde dehydrogenase
MLTERTYPEPRLFIGGEWLDATGRTSREVVNPATGEVLARLPNASSTDLDDALAAAQRGFEVWRTTPAFERAQVVKRAAVLLRERAAEIATVQTLEQGKPYTDSYQEILGAAEIFDWFAEEGCRTYGRVVPPRVAGQRMLVLREPVGPVAAFSPWNFPATIPARKLSAALATGCSVVIKPAEETPGTTLALVRAFDDAGLPKGVLNVVFGEPAEISRRLIASEVIRKISFTGSIAVGKQLARLAADGMKRTTMELGGHAPVIVFGDANLDLAVLASIAAKVRNAGQICIAPTRFYLHARIHDAFVERFAAAAKAIRVGDGLDPAVKMGPLANPRRLEAMERFTSDAVAHGATLVTGGERIGSSGFFYRPTVLADVPASARIMNEEPFGPVIVTSRFTDLDEVIAQANRLPYGLAAYAYTESLKTATAIGDRLDVGMVGINGSRLGYPEVPFGGVKESGHGSEGGIEGLEGYLTTKLVSQL